MSCPRSRHLLTEYFDDKLSSVAREEINRHLQICEFCGQELADLLEVQSTLMGWHEQQVPHWDRGVEAHPRIPGRDFPAGQSWIWQWLPAGFSFVMLVLFMLNVSVTHGVRGYSVTFGDSAPPAIQQLLAQQLSSFSRQQQQQREQDLQLFMTEVVDRLDRNNLRLMEAVMEQARELTAENFAQIYTYFEQQRQLDMESVQISYEQLVASDFETLRTMEQLANYVQFQGELR